MLYIAWKVQLKDKIVHSAFVKMKITETSFKKEKMPYAAPNTAMAAVGKLNQKKFHPAKATLYTFHHIHHLTCVTLLDAGINIIFTYWVRWKAIMGEI